MPAPAAPRTVYEVSELAELLRSLIEDALPRVWVQGEISNLARPASGHWYFTLKDARAQLRCCMFRNANQLVRPPPKDGDQVLIRGQISLYPARGDLQLVCEHLEPAGQGALLRAFEELKRRLASEGLFDEHLKRELPAHPRAIGLVTSASGAVLHDVCTTLARRYPLAPVYLYPVPVQGPEAPPAIVRALRELPQRAPVDVLILARGGGSLEDLWAFNEESVARAIRACAVPVISAIGHETDVTIADFAADLRAPTPTAAAEQVAPDIALWRTALAEGEQRLLRLLQRRLEAASEQLAAQQARLQAQHPGRRLQDRAQRLDELALRQERAIDQLLQRRRERLDAGIRQLRLASPAPRVEAGQRQLDGQAHRLEAVLLRRLQAARAALQRAEAGLSGLNPRAVLDRGYAIALDAEGRALTDAGSVQAGAAVQLLLARGRLDTHVTTIHPAGD
ncbi:MAG TPA: exodeoxyribonuclease VII large subunit [Solimonas sp.]|nr:exodeoxyribonuclease VII large subunit [Solimonas sp.]